MNDKTRITLTYANMERTIPSDIKLCNLNGLQVGEQRIDRLDVYGYMSKGNSHGKNVIVTNNNLGFSDAKKKELRLLLLAKYLIENQESEVYHTIGIDSNLNSELLSLVTKLIMPDEFFKVTLDTYYRSRLFDPYKEINMYKTSPEIFALRFFYELYPEEKTKKLVIKANQMFRNR